MSDNDISLGFLEEGSQHTHAALEAFFPRQNHQPGKMAERSYVPFSTLVSIKLT